MHVHDALTRLVARTAPHSLAFITDAISATGVGDGTYTLGEQIVEVHEGRATLGDPHKLAGSTLTMDVAVQRGVRALGLCRSRSFRGRRQGIRRASSGSPIASARSRRGSTPTSSCSTTRSYRSE